jgi:hypothetical protein
VLCATGAHGGEVKILKDDKLSRNTNSDANKPSFGGAYVDKLFKPSTFEGGLIECGRIWLQQSGLLLMIDLKEENFEIWQEFEKLPPYLTTLKR